MYLKKIEISGFKSFAQKTTLEFLASCNFRDNKNSCGITAIVGPNGSGKSNVADAIRWAMGEQSMKNLRGKKSEDVIFAGSGKKARLGSASVTLFFDNHDKRIPLEFSEVAITRKLFRSGDSEYLINGSKVRLIDVIDLLAKAGVGKESYCVINQGMSDAVLNASPAERRIVLEDAAGVKPYQIKKERAIRKLETTEANLLRVNDLINEITPHLRLLKRQADKALKSKELEAVLREKQVKLFSYLWYNFQKEKENLSVEKNNLGAKMMNLQREIDKINDELSQETKEAQNFSKIELLEKKREELRNELNNLEKQLVITEGRLEIEKEKIIEKEIIESIPVDLGFVKSKLERIRSNHEELIRRLEKIESLAELQELKEYARVIQEQLFELYEAAGQGKVELKKDLSAEALAQEEKIKKLETETGILRKKIMEQKGKLAQAGAAIEEEIKNNRQQRERFFAQEKILREKQNEFNELKDKFNEAKVSLAKIEVREEDLLREIQEELKTNVNELDYDGRFLDENELRREIAKIKIHLEQAGGIDPLVVEEYEETKKRHEFLTQESEDLKKAIKSCKEVIKEMDIKIKEVFEEAFKKIDAEFTKYFKIIFGGGNAHLTKIKIQRSKIKIKENPNADLDITENGDDEGEAGQTKEVEELGVDIFACPPGKKISNLNMLSGGERSLTSIALLFAIIAYNPPPFAVLDEVEAALDEANSQRFGRILQELSSNTQFVIITHNRETMRQASLLYGVTMGEDGISKLLSVRLDQVKENGQIVK